MPPSCASTLPGGRTTCLQTAAQPRTCELKPACPHCAQAAANRWCVPPDSSYPLQTAQPRECELKRVRLSSIRRRLGLQTGGARALGVLGMLSGSGACPGVLGSNALVAGCHLQQSKHVRCVLPASTTITGRA